MRALFTTYLLVLLCTWSQAQNPFVRVRSLLESEEYPPALRLLDSCRQADYQKDSSLFYRGLIQVKKGNLQEAKTIFTDLNRTYPEFYEAHYLNGLIQFADDNYGKSIQAFNKVLKINPKHLKALYNRSIVLGLLEDYLSAIEDLSTCISIQPSYSKAYYSRAYWYEYTGNYVEAGKDYLKVIELEPKNYDAYMGLAYIYQNLKENDKACDIVTKAINAGSQIAVEVKENFCR